MTSCLQGLLFPKVSEYYQEIHTADQSTAPRGRAIDHLQYQDIGMTIKLKQQFSLPRQDDCKTRKDTK